MTQQPESARSQGDINVSWPDVIRFLRQLSHDLRNQLNAVELQSAFLAELATDAEMKDEITRLRKMVSQCGAALQKLSGRINPPAGTATAYGASDLIEDLRSKVQIDFSKEAAAIQWQNEVSAGSVDVDPQQLQEAILEVLRNAFEHRQGDGSIRFIARTEGDNLILSLYEPKAEFNLPTENWGREPLRHVNRGHYGLGLNRARSIIEGQGGNFRARYDAKDSELVTTITLPLSTKSA